MTFERAMALLGVAVGSLLLAFSIYMYGIGIDLWRLSFCIGFGIILGSFGTVANVNTKIWTITGAGAIAIVLFLVTKPDRNYVVGLITGEFPEGPFLNLAGNKHFELRQIEYLDETGARVAAEAISKVGNDFQVRIDHAKLVRIHNLKPRQGHEAIPMQFRLRLIVESREQVTRTIPALLQPRFKQISNVSTYFMKIVG